MIVIRAGTHWDGPWRADQHVARHIAGVEPVLYVDPPVSFRSAKKNPHTANLLREPTLRVIAKNLFRLTPRVPPGKSRAWVSSVIDVLERRQVRSAIQRIGRRVKATVTVNPGMLGTLNEGLDVYWARDDFRAGAELMALSPRRLARLEDRVVAEADLVIAVSPRIEHKWRDFGKRVVFIPNGCDAVGLAARAEAAEDVYIPRPIVGLVGTLSSRIDEEILWSIAREGISLLLVGPAGADYQASILNQLTKFPNVQWVGPKPADSIARYLSVMDLGIVPYSDSEFNRYSFPLKILEYLAAGLPVVSTNLPILEWLDTDLVISAESSDEFVIAVKSTAGETRTGSRVRKSFAALHDWSVRADSILGSIRSAQMAIDGVCSIDTDPGAK